MTTVAGVAKDAKLGAVLVSDDQLTYVRGLARWPAGLLDRPQSLPGCLGTRQLPVARELPAHAVEASPTEPARFTVEHARTAHPRDRLVDVETRSDGRGLVRWSFGGVLLRSSREKSRPQRG